jgi:alanyl-tRNA synthetase
LNTDWDLNKLRLSFLKFFEAKSHLVYPSASLKPDDPTLMFTSAGMVQFKPYFLGATPKFANFEGTHQRVVTAQKCLRIGDVENVGRTLRHHSFFEMLGNFSFGDYFKKEAAAWTWEYLTSPTWMDLDPNRLHITIYIDDDEAFEIWTEHVGVSPDHISRWGEDENFWPGSAISKGPNGPCGPCSEIFFDRGQEYGTADETGPNTGSGDRYIEIWNLVFTQYDRQDNGVLTPLPQQNIDTGLGFERLAAVMTGVDDAYATELFQPTIRELASRSGIPYEGRESVSHRVIADHVRAVTCAITDGVLPTNDGPGYVIKMLIRRASRHAWLLGLREPILHTLVQYAIEAMGNSYPDLINAQERVQGIVRTEEQQFLRTLESGISRVEEVLENLPDSTLPGNIAFDLWQTHGFPLDITKEMATEHNITVDTNGYEVARHIARKIAQGGATGRNLFGDLRDDLGSVAKQHGETTFTGYTNLEGNTRVLGLLFDDQASAELVDGQHGQFVLEATPLYPRGGGQIGDKGKLEWEEGRAEIIDTTRTSHGLILHHGQIIQGRLQVGQNVRATTDSMRNETSRHHTATHLLHAALRKVLGTHVAQAGSLVEPERLRFDFSHSQALNPSEIENIESLVNSWIQDNSEIESSFVSVKKAREYGAMMLFGEKYGETVRMVEVTASTDTSPLSIELCGGTHVQHTGDIGPFLITEEEAVSAGVRRITAVSGMNAIAYISELRDTINRLKNHLGADRSEIESRVARLGDDLKNSQRKAKELREKLAAAQTTGRATHKIQEAAGFTYASAILKDLDAGALRTAADTMLTNSAADLVVLGSGTLMVVKVTGAAQRRGAHAGDLIRGLAARAGGGGGGGADIAQAGVKDSDRITIALEAIPEILGASE